MAPPSIIGMPAELLASIGLVQYPTGATPPTASRATPGHPPAIIIGTQLFPATTLVGGSGGAAGAGRVDAAAVAGVEVGVVGPAAWAAASAGAAPDAAAGRAAGVDTADATGMAGDVVPARGFAPTAGAGRAIGIIAGCAAICCQ